MSLEEKCENEGIKGDNSDEIMFESISKPISDYEIDQNIKTELDDIPNRFSILDSAQGEKSSKKSCQLFAKNYPKYHHYSNKINHLKRLHKIDDPFTFLPEIRGQTLSQLDVGEIQSKKFQGNLSFEIHTLQDLTKSILQYGGKSDVMWLKFPNIRNNQKLVRPGFSARRYMANLVQHWNEKLVDKLISEGRVLEKTIFKNSVLLPHIRRRLSADLSRFPEPYRILKQMLIATGPLNEYSFVWNRKISNYNDGNSSSEREYGVKSGDIQILVKTNNEDNNEIYKEVNYEEMTHGKKKNILSNLLLKSAMNHAIKIKDHIIDRNTNENEKYTKDDVHNIHIPRINFDMMEAVTDLLNKETLETLSHNISVTSSGFRGQALRADRSKANRHTESDFNVEGIPEKLNIVNIDSSMTGNQDHSISMSNIIPSLEIRLQPTHVEKVLVKRKHQNQESKTDNHVITFNPFSYGMPDYESQKEAQSNAYVEKLKHKVAESVTRKEKIMPYGKYREREESETDHSVTTTGDVDPSSSFKNWKYSAGHHSNNKYGRHLDSSISVSDVNTIRSSSNKSRLYSGVPLSDTVKVSEPEEKVTEGDMSSLRHQNRLIQLLSEHADNVAEKVLNNSGGKDFATDVNVAIMEILMQKQDLSNQTGDTFKQVWNVDVDDLKNDDEYSGMIKDIFKSVFKEQLTGITNDSVNISLEIMSLLQDGSNLVLDQIEVQTDPITGQSTIKLKEGISVEKISDSEFIEKHLKMENVSKDESGNFISIPSAQPQHLTSILPQRHALFQDPNTERNKMTLEIKRGNAGNKLEKEKTRSVKAHIDQMNLEEPTIQFPSIVTPSSGTIAAQHATELHNIPDPSERFRNVDLKETSDRRSININLQNVYQSEVQFPATTNSTTATSSVPNEQYSNVETPTSVQMNTLHVSTNNAPKKKFITGRVDDTTDLKTIYSQSHEKVESRKVLKQISKKVVGKQGKSKLSTTVKSNQGRQSLKRGNTVKMKQTKASLRIPEAEKKVETYYQDEIPKEYKTLIEKETSEDVLVESELSQPTEHTESRYSEEYKFEQTKDQSDYDVDEENQHEDDEEVKERKRLVRQNREAKRYSDAEKKRLEVERRRKEKEEQRRLENKRREMEETLTKKLEEERRQKEEEYRLKREKEKEDELFKIEEAKRQDYLRQKQIERERKEKEEYLKKLEQIKLKQALEEQQRKLEQERLAFEESERIRIENEIISRMQESERILFLQKKAEEEERQKIREEEEKKMREELARAALLEAQRIAQQQAKERALLEARLNFLRGLRVENEGMKKFLNITPTFVWSYFEFLKILGLESNPTTNRLEFQ